LTKLGVPSNALLAVFGSAGLAIGLALKDTLSNIAAGVMMLTLRPLKVGEFIDTPQAAGTVDEIGLFATTLKNTEGIYIYPLPKREEVFKIYHVLITLEQETLYPLRAR